MGWKAFQDLCATVLSEILGQTYEILEPGKDVGKDGGFKGSWVQRAGEDLRGSFVVQCKHTSTSDKPLSRALLKDEIQKARHLKRLGYADVYLLFTNHKVTGVREQQIKKLFEIEAGISDTRVYGSAWLTQKVLENSRLRMLVPRLYGLGDLTQILDERAYRQAEQLLVSLQDDLRKYVPTDAYRLAARALEEHRFVLLLGEPAAGKSTIAATLAVSASDRWHSRVVRIDEPGEFTAHWNPDEPDQFFWIEDAFGATQYRRSLSNQWNQVIPKIRASLSRNARIVITSRDYIYNEAREDLKQSELPLIRESQVVVDVEALTLDERRQILYNHVKLGDQPRKYKTAIKPFMSYVAALEGFSPELARRLGTSLFTKNLAISHFALTEFISRKHDFLVDVIRGLSKAQRASLYFLFLNGGQIPAPSSQSEELEKRASRLGLTLTVANQSFRALEGSLTKLDWQNEQSFWTFRHPTMREAISSLIQEDPGLLDVYVSGASDLELFSEAVCGEVDLKGAKVRIPQVLYDHVVGRIQVALGLSGSAGGTEWNARYSAYAFLARRCSRAFLERFLQETPGLWDSLLNMTSYLSVVPEPLLIVSLHRQNLLPEEIRRRYVERVEYLAVNTPDSDWLQGVAGEALTSEEIEGILDSVKEELLPYLDDSIDAWFYDIPRHEYGAAQEHIQPYQTALGRFEEAFAERGMDDAVELIASAQDSLELRLSDFPDLEEMRERDYDDRGVGSVRSRGPSARDLFDDIDL